ncbi:MAG: lysophospholipid acyltransferase family protein [Rhodospirillales bacterium]
MRKRSRRALGEVSFSAMVSRPRALWRLITFLLILPPCMLVQAVALLVSPAFARRFPLWFHRQVLRLFAIRVQRRGRMSRTQPTLFICNHISYLDIEVLGSVIKGSFVAKSEVRTWPVFGWLARLQRSVFVERRVHRTATARDEMSQRLEAGDSLILFAEGTSSDGNRVLPFKSALFAAAAIRPKGQDLTVQPVSIAYSHLDGMPMGRFLRPYFAWYGDMDLAGHIWDACGLGRVTVTVEFHPPVTLAELGSRKALAEHCQAAVERGVTEALSGRRAPRDLRGSEPQAVGQTSSV